MTINYSDQKVIKDKKSIFLAGPTPRDANIESWRGDACRILEEKGFDGVVYIPECSNHKPKANYIDQAQWEREALSNASVIVFWIPRKLPDMPGFTTNVEFGYWLHTGKIIYGRPDGAEKIKYLDWLYNVDTKQKPYNTIEDLLSSAMNQADNLYASKNRRIIKYEK